MPVHEHIYGFDLIPETKRGSKLMMVDLDSTEVETLEFMSAFIRRTHPAVVIECGTYIGVGAVFLGNAVKANGEGHVWSVESNSEIISASRELIKEKGLSEFVTVVEGNTLEVDLPEPPYGVVFHDAEREPVHLTKELERFACNLTEDGISFIHDSALNWWFQDVRTTVSDFAKQNGMNHFTIHSARGLEMLQRSGSNGS